MLAYLLSGCGNFFRFNRLSRVKHSIYMRFRTQAADVQHARFTSIDPAGWTRDREQKFWREVRHSHLESLSRKTSWNCATLNKLELSNGLWSPALVLLRGNRFKLDRWQSSKYS
jgi:hypothetical protein